MNQKKKGSWLGRLLGSFKQATRDAGQIGGQAEPVAQHSSAEPGTPPDEELDRLRKAVERSPGDSQAYIELGDALKKRHRLEEALTSYGRVLEREPDSALAHYKLGNVLMDMGRMEESIARYDRALTLKPDYPEALNNQGNALKARGRQNEALQNYERALRYKPDLIQAHISMGNVLRELGRLEESVESFGRALQLNANSVLAHNNLGLTWQELCRLDEAVSSYQRALELDPNYPEAHTNLGNVLSDLGRLDEAMASYRRAVELQPDLFAAHNNLAGVLVKLGRLDEAISSYRQVLKLNPDFAEAHKNLGNVLCDLWRLDEAVACYRTALDIDPDYAAAHNNLGNALSGLDQKENAMSSYQRALELDPNYPEALTNLGNVLSDLGRLDEAMASYRRAVELRPDFIEAQSNLVSLNNHQYGHLPGRTLAEAKKYGAMVAKRAKPYSHWKCIPDPGRCLRVGWVSGDFGVHSVGHFVEGVLKALSTGAHGRMELFAYSSFRRDDTIAERIRASCHGWRSVVGVQDERLADMVHADGIDILIDLSGYSVHNRLPMFAWKPAPVQVTWLGYLGTTGISAIDYLIADPWVFPEAEEIEFTERIVRLPESYVCLTAPSHAVEVSESPAKGNGYITFGSFNNLAKVNDHVVEAWARVLHAVQGSRLFLKSKLLAEDRMRQVMCERFARHGIDPQRLILEGMMADRSQHLAAYNRVDIALDPFPYPGVTTSAESLWMGVPVLTLAGERFISRQGVGLMMNAGLPEWIATDLDDYVARAVKHASDIEKLSALRRGLRQRVLVSPIFDAQRFAGHFETALRGMWEEWCERQKKN